MAVEARRVIHTSADVGDWLARLGGKTLVCDCHRQPNECWAWLLQSEFVEAFSTVDTSDNCYMHEVEDDDLDVLEDTSFETYVT